MHSSRCYSYSYIWKKKQVNPAEIWHIFCTNFISNYRVSKNVIVYKNDNIPLIPRIQNTREKTTCYEFDIAQVAHIPVTDSVLGLFLIDWETYQKQGCYSPICYSLVIHTCKTRFSYCFTAFVFPMYCSYRQTFNLTVICHWITETF